ncbi:glycosyltransferase family 1 protein [Bacillus sp. UMB0893]|uniref:glycosyltransferase family 1 protein n=1 Tax=Bacillus sp. UMB0893 TaxID=2066053 RepID=UPI000C75F657|nr:glycosyltransferase family 1 protein [Bacillus sp. UMB0893]PLR68741.1 glycosyltransferase family 1 protein [Bacillus sp. UMB0893]
MKPMRVLQVVTIMNRGGLETMLMNYYRKMDRNKIQFDFMVHRNERGDYDSEIEKLGGRIYRLPSIRPGNYKKYFKSLDQFFIKNSGYKIVHSHINENSSFVLRAAKKANIPCRISHSHLAGLPIDYKYPFRLFAKRYLNENANKYFACSDEAGKWLFGKGINSIIFKNAIDCTEFEFNQDTRLRMRSELNIEDKFVIGHVGRFNPQKNHKFLIEVFNEIYKKNKKAVLMLVGEGDLLNDSKRQVSKLGLDKVVRFLGLRNDVANLMQSMDLFLFPSLYEGLGVVLIEAQANGLHCITSTGTPLEAKVTESIEFLSLNMTVHEWAEHIINIRTKRYIQKINIADRGYDVNDNVKWLSEFYTQQSNLSEVN